MLLSGSGIDRQSAFDMAGLLISFTDLASRYDFNHRNMFLSYLRMKGLPLVEDGAVITGKLESGEELRMEFDGNGAIVMLNGKSFSLQPSFL